MATCKVFTGIIVFSVASFVSTEPGRHLLHQWSKFQVQNLLLEKNEGTAKGDSITPLSLVFLPESYKTQRCLDGSSFGYYIRHSKSSLNSHKWVFF